MILSRLTCIHIPSSAHHEKQSWGLYVLSVVTDTKATEWQDASETNYYCYTVLFFAAFLLFASLIEIKMYITLESCFSALAEWQLLWQDTSETNCYWYIVLFFDSYILFASFIEIIIYIMLF